MRLIAEAPLSSLLIAINDPKRNSELFLQDASNRNSVTISYT